MKFTLVLAAAASVLCIASPSIAQVSLENKVLRESVRISSDGTRTTSVAPARTMAPGNVAVYVMTYRNGGTKPATNLVIDNAVPADVRFSGAGKDSAEPMVSIDRGKTYGRLQDLKVASAGASRAAQFSDVTNVRWKIAGPVAPGASGSVSYRGVLK
jgi:uncharacterized repeat protein (TIGR01451 family)